MSSQEAVAWYDGSEFGVIGIWRVGQVRCGGESSECRNEVGEWGPSRRNVDGWQEEGYGRF